MFSCKRGLASLIRSGHSKMNKFGQRNEHTLPALAYDIKALEPIISAEIMTLHYTKHHATYVANLNAAEVKFEEARCKNDLSAMIALQPALRFNGGGHINHSIFWKNLSPNGGMPSCELEKAIKEEFCSLEAMKSQLSAASIAVQGSGWGWLGFNKQTKRLQIAACANQDPLQATTGLIPLFGIDVWEHAYYLQYRNVRADYVKAIFQIINWEDVSNRYQKAQCC